MSRIWEYFLNTLSLVKKSRSCYRKLTSPRPSCLCNYSISWLDSVYMAQNRVPHCKTISTLRIIYHQSSPEIWPLKTPATRLRLILASEKERDKNGSRFSNEHFVGCLASEWMSFEKEKSSWIINSPLCRWEKVSRFCWSHGLIFWHNNREDVQAATWTVLSNTRSIGKWVSSSHLTALLMRHWSCHII